MDPLTNDERIAALLDGRLNEQERAALLAELGTSDDELDLLIESAGITAELEEEDRAAGVVPITMPRPGEAEPRTPVRPPVWRRMPVLAAAAVAVLAIGGGVLLTRGAGRQGSASDAAARALAAEGGVPEDLIHVFAETRGGGGELGVPAVSFRYGTLDADLEIAALRGSDQERVRATADSVAILLAENGQNAAARDYARIAERPDTPTPESLQRLRRETTDLLNERMVAFGRWVQMARIAAYRRDAAFFRSGTSASYVTGTMQGWDPGTASALQRVRDAISTDGTPDWARLRPALDELQREAS
jgi:hypothetical protein